MDGPPGLSLPFGRVPSALSPIIDGLADMKRCHHPPPFSPLFPLFPWFLLPTSDSHRMRVCKTCHCAVEMLRKALLLGRVEEAMAALGTGCVILDTPYTIYHGEVRAYSQQPNSLLLSAKFYEHRAKSKTWVTSEPTYGSGGRLQPAVARTTACLLYTSPSPRDQRGSRMPSSA